MIVREILSPQPARKMNEQANFECYHKAIKFFFFSKLFWILCTIEIKIVLYEIKFRVLYKFLVDFKS